MKVKGEFVLREIAGDYILVPTGKAALRINSLITMDAVGMFIWKKIEQGMSELEILHEILRNYEVEQSEAEEDLRDFVKQLVSADIIEKE